LKTITVVAFRGDENYSDKSALIKFGHVGIQYKGQREVYAFRPTDEAIEEIGGKSAAGDHLLAGNDMVGSVYDDRDSFVLAYELYKKYANSEKGCDTVVIAIDYQFSDDEFEKIKSEVELWYNGNRTAIYGFPGEGERVNCVTFLKRFGISLPSDSGLLRVFIPAMILHPDSYLWEPEG
jgi:hypothetical protein